MDINILTKRYSTPTALKALVSILFIVTFILLVAVPVFELIPQDQYINVFNLQGVPSGSYESTSYTVFTMLQNDYGSGLAMGIMLTQCILSVICGIAFIWTNRPKFAAIPASVRVTSSGSLLARAEVLLTSLLTRPPVLYSSTRTMTRISFSVISAATGYCGYLRLFFWRS